MHTGAGMKNRGWRSVGILVALLGISCAPDTTSISQRRGTSPGSGKADGYNLEYDLCHSEKALTFINDPSTNADVLADALSSVGVANADQAARSALSSRNGADRQIGTPDDEPFSSLGDLLHPSTGLSERDVRAFVDEHVGTECRVEWAKHVDWTKTPPTADFIHKDNIDSASSSWSSSRQNTEIEVALEIHGVPGAQLHAALEDRDGFRDLRKARIMEAFTYAFGVNRMPWDAEHHAAREAYPLVAVSIESERYILEPEEDDNDMPVQWMGRTLYEDLEPQLDLGTDLNTDVYYDTRDFLLYKNDITLRGRARWDGLDCIRRLLVGAKFGTGFTDPATGIKEVFKVDVRTDSGGCGTSSAHNDLLVLDEKVRAGVIPWGGTPTPIIETYSRMTNPNGAAANASATDRGSLLSDVVVTNPDDPSQEATFAEALAIEPKVHIYSTRSRFHFNEASIDNLVSLYNNGRTQMEKLIAYMEAKGSRSRAIGEMQALIADMPEAATLYGKGGGTWSPTPFSSRAELEAAQETAEDLSARFHDIAAMFGRDEDGDARGYINELTGSQNRDIDDDRTDALRAWRQITEYLSSGSPDLLRTHTADFYRDYYYENMSDPGNPAHQAKRQEFQDYAIAAGSDNDHPYDNEFDDFEPLTSEQDWQAFEAQLDYAWLSIVRRQLEAAGSAARALAFDGARNFYVPASTRRTSNFLIDTMDFTEYFSNRVWKNINPDDMKRLDFNPADVLHASLVNELQIELGSEKAYVDRLQALDKQIADHVETNPNVVMTGACEVSDRNAITDQTITEALQACDGVRYVFEQYKGLLTYLSEIKGPHIVDAIEDVLEDNPSFGPVPDEIRWQPAARSKGQTGIALVTGTLE